MNHWKSNPRQMSRWGCQPPHLGHQSVLCSMGDALIGAVGPWRKVGVGWAQRMQRVLHTESVPGKSKESEPGGTLARSLDSDGREIGLGGPTVQCVLGRGFVGSRWRRPLNSGCCSPLERPRELLQDFGKSLCHYSLLQILNMTSQLAEEFRSCNGKENSDSEVLFASA